MEEKNTSRLAEEVVIDMTNRVNSGMSEDEAHEIISKDIVPGDQRQLGMRVLANLRLRSIEEI